MPLTDVVIWISATMLVLAVVITAAFALLQRPRGHSASLDDIIAEVASKKKDGCP